MNAGVLVDPRVVKCTNYTFCYYYRDLARIETLSIIERDSYIWLFLVTATLITFDIIGVQMIIPG